MGGCKREGGAVGGRKREGGPVGGCKSEGGSVKKTADLSSSSRASLEHPQTRECWEPFL